MNNGWSKLAAAVEERTKLYTADEVQALIVEAVTREKVRWLEAAVHTRFIKGTDEITLTFPADVWAGLSPK